jgi:hypothetical protein
MSSRIPSDEQAVIAWFRDYLSGLASIGIRLNLTATQQSELKLRLLAVCQRPGKVIATKRGPKSRAVISRLSDPIENRWLDDPVGEGGNYLASPEGRLLPIFARTNLPVASPRAYPCTGMGPSLQ